MSKPRRGRKDRINKHGEKSGTTSSSGAQFDAYNGYCDYNPTQFKAQYAMEEVDSEQGDHFLEAKRKKQKIRSQYECMADMVFDPMPLDDEDLPLDNHSNIDPEDLRPYN